MLRQVNNRKAKRNVTHRNTDPLRRVTDEGVVDAGYWTGEYTGVDVDAEKLECGHIVRVRVDIIGRTNAYRRRCRYCRSSSTEAAK